MSKISPWQWMLSIIRIRKQNAKLKNIEDNLIRFEEKFVPRAFLNQVSIHLAEHCNLNCYSCDHFSQLAKKGYYSLEVFTKDIKRLSEITQGLVEKFHLMGGEPLLNKDCIQYFKILRQYFPKSKIWIVTNGILLPKQTQEFWLACQENNIELHPTKYPVNVDWDLVVEKCKEYKITLEFFNKGEKEKYSFKTCLNPKGDSNPLENWKHCHRANECNSLHQGKIFPCSVTAYIKHFNEHFKQNLELTEFDSIDIHNPNITYKDILQFVAKPIPFCRYCDIKKMTFQPWLRSKKDINEYYTQS